MLAQKSFDGRKTDRIRCRIRGTIRFLHQRLDVIILDISRTGMAISLQGWIDARPGSTIEVETKEFGMMEATVRWYRAGKMGVKIEQTTNTVAQINAYFKNYHKDAQIALVK